MRDCRHAVGWALPLLLLACAEESHFSHEPLPFRAPHSARQSPLVVQFPELDQRIELHRAKSGQLLDTLYPDLWDPDTRGIRDLALSKRHAFALISRYGLHHDNRLFVAELPHGALRIVPLPPNPQRLTWSSSGKLLIGHFGSHPSAPGKLSVFDPQSMRLQVTVALDGACLAATGSLSRAFVVEELARRGPDGTRYSRFALLDIDLEAGAIAHRVALPAGARDVAIGPSGLLYVSHASGSGLHATDGSISVYDPVAWQLVDRIPLDMVVRRMRTSRNLLLLNLLSPNGDAWFGALRADHQMRYDFKLPELVSAEMALIGDTAYLAARGKPRLVTVQLLDRPRLGELNLPDLPPVDRVGLLRAAIAGQN